MSKLGKFAAACAAAVCVFGAVAGTPDENKIVPRYWYTFNGVFSSIGEKSLTFSGETNNSWVDANSTSGRKAYEFKTGSSPWLRAARG